MNRPLFPEPVPAPQVTEGGLARPRRDSLLLRADMWPADEAAQARSVIVRNLSSTGMMAESTKLLPVGRRVTIALRNIGEVAGTIVWTLDDRMGVSFDSEIDPLRARKPLRSA